MKRKSWIAAPTGCGLVLYVSMSVSMKLARAESVDKDFFDMSLGELLSVEITSVSKKPQPVSQAAAAVFVITQEDIRRSGVTSIPEALRMVPGLAVARIDGNKWAISSRGFNGRFANKLLVLLDGRSVYTPTFAGVYWDVQDTLLADIERIEVIRGPGASLWGSNAVNGVINIITKSAANTQGALLSAGAGNLERGFGSLRYGGTVGDLGHYRVYAKYFNRGNNYVNGSEQSANDHWDQFRSGFRADLTPQAGDEVTVQGDFYDGRSGERANVIAPDPLRQQFVRDDQDVLGFNVLTRWQHTLSATDSLTLQAYYDQTERHWVYLNERRQTGDLDIQYRSRRFDSHDLLLGFGYRFTQDYTRGSFMARLDPPDRGTQLYSAFLQDDIALIEDYLTLTLGSKLEHNDFTGFEGQPSARILWTPDRKNSLWASVARAVRIPSRGDQNSSVITGFFSASDPNNPLRQAGLGAATPDLLLAVRGTTQFDSESVVAYEAGYKHEVSAALSFDLALFYNRYTRLRSATPATPLCEPGSQSVVDNPLCLLTARYLSITGNLDNHSAMDSYGAELATDWKPHAQWRLQGAYTFLKMNPQHTQHAGVPGDDPQNNPVYQVSLRTSWTPRSDLDFDLWLRYVDRIGGDFGAASDRIPSYTQMDLRAAWRPWPTLELSVAGFNLLDRQHPEFRSEVNDVASTGIRRSIYGQFRWEF